MKVFICWSEERSKVVAETLHVWLRRVIQELKPFLSTQDIRSGKRWIPEIAGELSETKFGILCLTAENLDSPWLNFEAGALSKTIDDKTFVCPYLIGGLRTAEVPVPLGQFQSNLADKEGTKKLLKTINSALAEKKLEDMVEEILNTVRDLTFKIYPSSPYSPSWSIVLQSEQRGKRRELSPGILEKAINAAFREKEKEEKIP